MCRIRIHTYAPNGAFEDPIELVGADCGSSGSVGMLYLSYLLPFLGVEFDWKSFSMKGIGSGRESCKTFNGLTLTSFPFLLKEIHTNLQIPCQSGFLE